MNTPDFKDNFPKIDPCMKINDDTGNRKHGDHYDILRAVEKGTDQIRISPDGDIIDGTTNIGKAKLDWGAD